MTLEEAIAVVNDDAAYRDERDTLKWEPEAFTSEVAPYDVSDLEVAIATILNAVVASKLIVAPTDDDQRFWREYYTRRP